MSSLMLFSLVCLFGGIGAVCRFFVDSAINKRNTASFPIGTIIINVTACFLLGLIAGWSATHTGVAGMESANIKMILGTGLMGGYSTFSTASVEGFRQIQMGHYANAFIHSGGMLILSIIAGLCGLAIF